MILLVDLEHASLAERHPDYWPLVASRRLDAKYRLEALAGTACHIQHYTRFCTLGPEPAAPELVIFTGNNTPFDVYEAPDLAALAGWFRAPAVPTFTICGSYQLMAQAHGGVIGPMGGSAAPTEDPILPAGAAHELGTCRIDIEPRASLLFTDLGTEAWVEQHHFWEVRQAPAGFRVTARSEQCVCQALEHEHLPLAGVQFHPEVWRDQRADGRRILDNVVRWARRRGGAAQGS